MTVQQIDILRRRAKGIPGQRRPAIAELLFRAYQHRPLRLVIRRLLRRLEGGIMFSPTLRRIYARYYRVGVGLYSYGPSLTPEVFLAGTEIGNFGSFAGGIRVLRRNHPTNRASQHPLFFNRVVGLLEADAIASVVENPLIIGHDVWIGLNVIICPGCRNIGDGAIVGAGAVVTRDVPPYAIVGGNPAKLIRKRFSPEVEAIIATSGWWLRSLPELVEHLDLFTQEITEENLSRFAAAFPPRAKVSRP